MFSMQIVFFVLWKKSRNKQCVRPHGAHFWFITFFSQVNNKKKINVGDALKLNDLFQQTVASTSKTNS